jgi:hypothetical protein
MNVRISAERLALLPSPTLPIVYFAGAHVCLALALAVLVVRADLPGASVYHPRALALVHLITLGWISGSILGALYIVSPLAFGVSIRARRLDALACGSFWLGTGGMVAGFWTGRYGIIGAASVFVLVPFATIGTSLTRGLRRSRVPVGVGLHVVFAFVNVLAAGSAGIVLALNRLAGSLPWSPVSLAAAHAHLAALGWATMMILGVAYWLIPMFLPAAMPVSRSLGVSAILLEVGAIGLTGALVVDGSTLPWTLVVLTALLSFFLQVRRMVRERRPRSVDLPRQDWATWQTHTAMLYLGIAALLGLRLAAGGTDSGPPARSSTPHMRQS